MPRLFTWKENLLSQIREIYLSRMDTDFDAKGFAALINGDTQYQKIADKILLETRNWVRICVRDTSTVPNQATHYVAEAKEASIGEPVLLLCDVNTKDKDWLTGSSTNDTTPVTSLLYGYDDKGDMRVTDNSQLDTFFSDEHSSHNWVPYIPLSDLLPQLHDTHVMWKRPRVPSVSKTVTLGDIVLKQTNVVEDDETGLRTVTYAIEGDKPLTTPHLQHAVIMQITREIQKLAPAASYDMGPAVQGMPASGYRPTPDYGPSTPAGAYAPPETTFYAAGGYAYSDPPETPAAGYDGASVGAGSVATQYFAPVAPEPPAAGYDGASVGAGSVATQYFAPVAPEPPAAGYDGASVGAGSVATQYFAPVAPEPPAAGYDGASAGAGSVATQYFAPVAPETPAAGYDGASAGAGSVATQYFAPVAPETPAAGYDGASVGVGSVATQYFAPVAPEAPAAGYDGASVGVGSVATQYFAPVAPEVPAAGYDGASVGVGSVATQYFAPVAPEVPAAGYDGASADAGSVATQYFPVGDTLGPAGAYGGETQTAYIPAPPAGKYEAGSASTATMALPDTGEPAGGYIDIDIPSYVEYTP